MKENLNVQIKTVSHTAVYLSGFSQEFMDAMSDRFAFDADGEAIVVPKEGIKTFLRAMMSDYWRNNPYYKLLETAVNLGDVFYLSVEPIEGV